MFHMELWIHIVFRALVQVDMFDIFCKFLGHLDCLGHKVWTPLLNNNLLSLIELPKLLLPEKLAEFPPSGKKKHCVTFFSSWIWQLTILSPNVRRSYAVEGSYMFHNKCNVIIALLILSNAINIWPSCEQALSADGEPSKLALRHIFVIYIIRCLVNHKIIAFTER